MKILVRFYLTAKKTMLYHNIVVRLAIILAKKMAIKLRIKQCMEEIGDSHFIAFGDTQNSLITGSKLMLLTMVVLAIQDLNLEKYFKGLKRYFVISKKEKRDVENILSALNYVFSEVDDPLSFENFCFVFGIDIGLFRNLIVKYLKEDRGLALTEYMIWKEAGNGI